jgi:hypothetical protein
MTLDEVQRNQTYEVQMGQRKAPVYVVDVIPTGVIGKREVFIKTANLRRIGPLIESMSEWRLHNGEASV